MLRAGIIGIDSRQKEFLLVCTRVYFFITLEIDSYRKIVAVLTVEGCRGVEV